MKSEERYAKNLELFARDNPLEAFRLDAADCSKLRLCKTYENELNLVDESQKQKIYLHAQEGAVWEANTWAEGLPLENKEVVFVYGLGLGYYYLPLKQWLKENSKRYLVFLEDDPCVVRYFLQTELATEILENFQIIVKLLPKIEPNEAGWDKWRLDAADIFSAFAFFKSEILALQSYFLTRFDFFHALSVQWLAELSNAQRHLVEYYPLEPLVFHNYYANMFHLSDAIPAYKLANAMPSIPAVLCGAGPSLLKQLPLLRTLSENAFLMASGSAMNAVTQAAVTPHVGGAIDPTSVQASRQLTHFGFNVPLFYQNRFFNEAFRQTHGPLLYVTGSGGYRVSTWFEKELGIEDAVEIIMGVSTSNFLLEIANFLGCNPIVLIGMDLSYTEDKRYVEGVTTHSTDGKKQHRELNKKAGILMAVPGVDGQEVYTNNQWFYEAVCIGAFKERNPQVICLNATEGGMAIPSVPNVAFSIAIQEYFTTAIDVQGWFHGVMQNAAKDKISSVKIFQAMDKWKGSLERCVHYLKLLSSYFQEQSAEVQINAESTTLVKGKGILWQQELHQEPAYEFLLETLNSVFESLNSLRLRKLKWCDNPKMRIEELFAIEIERCRFLLEYAEDHLKSLQEGEKTFAVWQLALSNKIPQKETLKSKVELPEYRIKEGLISICEPELGLDLHVDFQPQLIPEAAWPQPGQSPAIETLIGKFEEKREGQTLYFYLDGNVKAEAFYKADQLHGPWSFYSPEGLLLYRSWFVEGKKEGKACAFYSTGALYSVLGYDNGKAQGVHVHYYPDGTLKTIEHYDKGLLHGIVRLYYPNGLLKKEQHFDQGKLHGQERLWNEQGGLILEAAYDQGIAIGISKRWHSNGKLARQVFHLFIVTALFGITF